MCARAWMCLAHVGRAGLVFVRCSVGSTLSLYLSISLLVAMSVYLLRDCHVLALLFSQSRNARPDH